MNALWVVTTIRVIVVNGKPLFYTHHVYADVRLGDLHFKAPLLVGEPGLDGILGYPIIQYFRTSV